METTNYKNDRVILEVNSNLVYKLHRSGYIQNGCKFTFNINDFSISIDLKNEVIIKNGVVLKYIPNIEYFGGIPEEYSPQLIFQIYNKLNNVQVDRICDIMREYTNTLKSSMTLTFKGVLNPFDMVFIKRGTYDYLLSFKTYETHNMVKNHYYQIQDLNI